MTRRSPFAWIINHFSYLQIYGFICLLFFLSLLPIGYFWVITHLVNVRLIDEQLGELAEEDVLKNLFNELQEHRLLAMRDLSEHREDFDNLRQLDRRIAQTFEEAKTLHRLTNRSRPEEAFIWKKIDLQAIESKWNDLLVQLPKLTPDESNILHTALIHELLIQFGNLSDKVGISFFKELTHYAMIEAALLRLPQLQENLSELYLVNAQGSLTEPASRHLVLLLTRLIGTDLDYLRQGVKQHLSRFSSTASGNMLSLLREYERAASQFLQSVERHEPNSEAADEAASPLLSPGNAAIKYGFLAWSRGLNDLNTILTAERQLVFRQLWAVLLLTLLLTLVAFSLGLTLTRTGTLRLSQLTAATDSFTNGNLSVRLPELYHDEVGRQAHAFNRMAQKLEEIVKRLYELLEATTTLASGDLKARIQIRGQDTEFDQVAHSFNKMAETFEITIGRLQQIGVMLTTSASEIASASQEQETLIVQQEATTREIALAAKEISSTAKKLAHTMNDVSQAADETSTLAVKGKKSLGNMEAVMRQMVEASSHIASKLAILNEKARNITRVITTITKIANQTNLVSFNASIESERAGEYGRGFAVIAREIRRLADQTAAATLDIAKIVNEIISAVSSSVAGVEEFAQQIRKGAEQVGHVGEQLSEIIGQVQNLTPRFEVVNQGMQTQSIGAEQIKESIAQLSQTAQQTTEAIHQFHRTVQELNHAANELRPLTPFLQPVPKSGSGEAPPKGSIKNHRSFEPVSRESTRQFNKTLSSLNSAAAKLKNLNIHFHSFKKQESKQPRD